MILQLPVSQRFTLELTPPPGFTADWPARKIHSDWGSVEETLGREGETVVSTLRLDMPSQTVQPASYPAFSRFCHAADELMTRPLVLRRRAR
jgi:hypothetical protein